MQSTKAYREARLLPLLAGANEQVDASLLTDGSRGILQSHVTKLTKLYIPTLTEQCLATSRYLSMFTKIKMHVKQQRLAQASAWPVPKRHRRQGPVC
jgi:hypothetical protein